MWVRMEMREREKERECDHLPTLSQRGHGTPPVDALAWVVLHHRHPYQSDRIFPDARFVAPNDPATFAPSNAQTPIQNLEGEGSFRRRNVGLIRELTVRTQTSWDRCSMVVLGARGDARWWAGWAGEVEVEVEMKVGVEDPA